MTVLWVCYQFIPPIRYPNGSALPILASCGSKFFGRNCFPTLQTPVTCLLTCSYQSLKKYFHFVFWHPIFSPSRRGRVYKFQASFDNLLQDLEFFHLVSLRTFSHPRLYVYKGCSFSPRCQGLHVDCKELGQFLFSRYSRGQRPSKHR